MTLPEIRTMTVSFRKLANIRTSLREATRQFYILSKTFSMTGYMGTRGVRGHIWRVSFETME